MAKYVATAAVAVLLVVICGWVLAQPGPGGTKQAEGGRYAVAPMGNSAVMVDSVTGKTWALYPSADGSPGSWLPLNKIDEPRVATIWLDQQKVKTIELKAREGK